MSPLALALVTVVALAVLPALWLLNSRVPRPSHLGASQGRLAPVPESPNCVSSQSERANARVDPLPFSGPPADALSRLDAVLSSFPRATRVQSTPDYRHYEFRTLLCRYVDDVEFLVDPTERVIHVRSASRIGYSDLGANRRRVEAIRQAWRASQGPADAAAQ